MHDGWFSVEGDSEDAVNRDVGIVVNFKLVHIGFFYGKGPTPSVLQRFIMLGLYTILSDTT